MKSKLKPNTIVHVDREGYSHYGELMSFPIPPAVPVEEEGATIMVRRVIGHPGTLEEVSLDSIRLLEGAKPTYLHYAKVGRLQAEDLQDAALGVASGNPSSGPRKDVVITSDGPESAIARVGQRIVGRADAWEDSSGTFVILNTEVRPQYRRRGIATQMYQQIERATGRKLSPAVSLSDDAFEFWKSFRPEAVAGDLRHIKDRLVGQPASKGGRVGTITKASGSAATLTYPDGMHSTLVGAEEINAALVEAGGNAIVPASMARRYVAGARRATEDRARPGRHARPGSGPFPVDMLRYDYASPLNFKLVETGCGVKAELLPEFEEYGEELIVVTATTRQAYAAFTPERWHSFMWGCKLFKSESIKSIIN